MTDNERDEILADIAKWRADNKRLYQALERLLGDEDKTLALISRGYEVAPEATREIHRQVAGNDGRILDLTRRLCE